MSSVLPILNQHIRRLARREIREQTRRTKRAGAQHRRHIAALKRLVKSLESRTAYLEKTLRRSQVAVAPTRADTGLRFRRDGLKTHRKRLDLSAREYGKLVGVSGLTIYNWESGKAHPRRRQLPALAAIRRMGKREARRRLDAK